MVVRDRSLIQEEPNRTLPREREGSSPESVTAAAADGETAERIEETTERREADEKKHRRKQQE